MNVPETVKAIKKSLGDKPLEGGYGGVFWNPENGKAILNVGDWHDESDYGTRLKAVKKIKGVTDVEVEYEMGQLSNNWIIYPGNAPKFKQEEIKEGIHDGLKAMFDYFDAFCKQKGCFYDISSDEADHQGFLLKDKKFANELFDHMAPLANDHKIHIEMDTNRKDGVMFSFTLESIQDDGHWKALSKKPKRRDFSPFSKPGDADKVRKGQTIYQKNPKLPKSLDKILEEKLRIPTVAVDLDGTLAKMYDKFDPKSIPDPRPGARKAMKQFQDKGYRIIIFTVRGDKKLVKDWCHEHDIHYDYVNENPDQPPDSSGKVVADVYIDDRAEDGSQPWSKIMDNVGDVLVKEAEESETFKIPKEATRRLSDRFKIVFQLSSVVFSPTYDADGVMEQISPKIPEPPEAGDTEEGLSDEDAWGDTVEQRLLRVHMIDNGIFPQSRQVYEFYLLVDEHPGADDYTINPTLRQNRSPKGIQAPYNEIADVLDNNLKPPKPGMTGEVLRAYLKKIEKLPEILDQYHEHTFGEDQRKSPTGKHRRSQSMYPSSFKKSKTFGGVGETVHGNMIPPQIERSTNVGLASADRTTTPGEQKKMKTQRKDLTDVPLVPPDLAAEQMIDRIDILIERTVPGTRIGRVRDNSRRSLVTKKIVPAQEAAKVSRAGEDELDMSVDLTSPFEVSENVIPDDEASKEKRDVLGTMAKQQNMRPLGVFGPADQRQKPAGTPNQSQSASNVRVQHPPDRGFDASSPSIATSGLNADKNVDETMPWEVPGGDPLKFHSSNEDADFFSALDDKFEELVNEDMARPEDGYGLVQRLIAELGMVTVARKIQSPSHTYIKACDGDVRLELEHYRDGFTGGPEKLSVYKRDRLLGELEVDLSKNTVVDETAEKIRDLIG